MRKILSFMAAFLLSAFAVQVASADLIISAVADGTQSGGNPKVIALEATAAIPDLSAFWILRDTNGTAGGPFTQSSEFQLPSITLSAGDSFIIYGNTDSQTFGNTTLGNVAPSILNGIANHNGDDILVISSSNTIAGAIDSFGLVGQGDTNFAENSVAVRNGSTANPTGVQDAGNFTISSYTDQLYADNFVVLPAVIPEPSSAVLIGLGGFGLCVVRRRK